MYDSPQTTSEAERNAMGAKRLLMIVGDYSEDYEVMVPFQMLTMVGHRVDVTCPGKAEGETICTAVHDFEGAQTYGERLGHQFTLNISFDDVGAQDYDGLVLPGGRAPEYLRLDPKVVEIVRSFIDSGRPIAAVCHGLQLLTAAGGIAGKRCTAYPACAPEVRLAGAEYVEIAVDKAMTDGNLVTAPAWPAHPDWMAQFLRLLGTKIDL